MFIVIFILTLLVLVVIHELGHFLMAKKFGIKVLEFGFGIPPKAWGKKIGETIYSLNWLPFGGFVRLLGEDDIDKKMLENKRSFSEWNERSFAAQAVWKRILVVVAGVIMNLLLAWVLFYIVIVWNGFKIVIPSPEPLIIIDQVEPNSPAQTAGLKIGDRILAINDEFVKDQKTLIQKIKSDAGIPTSLAISDWQGNNIKKITVVPRENPPVGQGALGVALSPFAFMEFKTLPEKIFSAPVYSIQLVKLTFVGFGQLFSSLGNRDFSKASQQVAGPIGIAVMTKDIVSQGIDAIIPYLYFVGILSLTLSIMNVLPIPALDGGRLFFLIVEAIIRKRVHPTFEKYVHSIGMVALLALIVIISISDAKKYIIPALNTFLHFNL